MRLIALTGLGPDWDASQADRARRAREEAEAEARESAAKEDD